MKPLFKFSLLFVLAVLSFNKSMAQVENYSLRLSSGGSVDCGPMPELNGLKNYTIQLWFCADAWTNGATLLSRGDDFSIRLGAESTLDFSIGGQNFSVKRTALTTGKWFPLMVIGKSGRLSIYLNNSLIKTVTSVSPLSDTGATFVLGGGTFQGRLDEVRVWNAELSSDFEYFTYTTLNKWVPQLSNLVAYYKFDQPWCENIVDYKPLFSPNEKLNHHGILSKSGAKREKVTDNQSGLPYLLLGGYTDEKRFYDNGIEVDKYLLSNDLIILGLQSYSDGHVRAICPSDHGTAHKAEYLDLYKTKARTGVLSLAGKGSYLECPSSVFTPSDGYTFETWVYIEEWTEGAFIFKKETSNAANGFSVRLGAEDKKQIIVRINGSNYYFNSVMRAGTWYYLAVYPGVGETNRNTVHCFVNTKTYNADGSLSDSGNEPMPSGMNDQKAYIGFNLNGKLDETIIWHKTLTEADMTAHRAGNIPMPGPGKPVAIATMNVANAYYRYNNPDNLGWDYYSQDEWRNVMASCYDGYTGYQIRIAVRDHNNWQNTISDASKRKLFAADLAELSKPYDGVELDLEWMDGTQTNLGLLADEILAVLPKGKTFMISHHQYGAYQFPKDKINKLDGYTFQQYGPQKTWSSYQAFVDGYNAFKNYGYPDDKIYLSFSSTTSSGYNDDGSWGRDVIGYNWGLVGSSYTPATDGSIETAKWNGYTFYFMGPIQVYNRAKFVRDKQLKGIFYWDICNDFGPSNKLSLNLHANYALNANVDPYVKEVLVNHPTGIQKPVVNQNEQAGNGEPVAYDLSGRRIDASKVHNGVVIYRSGDGTSRKVMLK